MLARTCIPGSLLGIGTILQGHWYIPSDAVSMVGDLGSVTMFSRLEHIDIVLSDIRSHQ